MNTYPYDIKENFELPCYDKQMGIEYETSPVGCPQSRDLYMIISFT